MRGERGEERGERREGREGASLIGEDTDREYRIGTGPPWARR